MPRTEDFYTEAKKHTKQLWDALSALEALQKESTALDYATTLPNASVPGANAGLTKLEITAVVFTTTNVLRAALIGGHASNLAKLL